RALRRGHVLQAHEGKESEAQRQPRIARTAWIVAAYGEDRRPFRDGLDDGRGERGRRGRVPDPSHRLHRTRAHRRLRILERGPEGVLRPRIADQAEGEGGHLSYLGLAVGQPRQQRGKERSVPDPPGGQRRPAAHAPVGIGEGALQLAVARAAGVLEGEDAGHLVQTRGGRWRRAARGRGSGGGGADEQVGEEAGHGRTQLYQPAPAGPAGQATAMRSSPSRRPSARAAARMRARAPGRPTAARCSGPRKAAAPATSTTLAPWIRWPIFRWSTSTKAATSCPRARSARAHPFPTGPAPHTTTRRGARS